MLIAIKLKRSLPQSPRTQYNLEKLKDQRTTEMFQAKVGEFSAVCLFDSDVDTVANSIRKVLLSTAEEVLGNLGKRGRRFNLGSQMRFWISATRDGS